MPRGAVYEKSIDSCETEDDDSGLYNIKRCSAILALGPGCGLRRRRFGGCRRRRGAGPLNLLKSGRASAYIIHRLPRQANRRMQTTTGGVNVRPKGNEWVRHAAE